MSDLVRTLAFAFKRKGADAMPGGDLRLLLAYDLRWFAPEDAKRVVARAIELGLLEDHGGALRPSFDVNAVEIPLNFRPTTLVLEEQAPAIPAAAPRAAPMPIAPAPTLPTPSVEVDRAAEDERRRRGLLMSLDVAQLVVRRRAGDDVTADAAALEAKVIAGDRSRA